MPPLSRAPLRPKSVRERSRSGIVARTETAPFIRRHRPSDRADVADIRVRTAHEGGDSSGLCPGPELMPSLFAHPHVELEPDFAFVLDDGTGRAVGHVLRAPDTAVRAFYGRLGCERWTFRTPVPSGTPAARRAARRTGTRRP